MLKNNLRKWPPSPPRIFFLPQSLKKTGPLGRNVFTVSDTDRRIYAILKSSNACRVRTRAIEQCRFRLRFAFCLILKHHRLFGCGHGRPPIVPNLGKDLCRPKRLEVSVKTTARKRRTIVVRRTLCRDFQRAEVAARHSSCPQTFEPAFHAHERSRRRCGSVVRHRPTPTTKHTIGVRRDDPC